MLKYKIIKGINMYCKNCGNVLTEGAAVCTNCGFKRYTGFGYCSNCGKEVPQGAAVCPSCGFATGYAGGGVGKSRLLVGLMGIFFGTLGVHNFILGYTGKAVAQLLITLLTCGIGGIAVEIWALIESINVLAGNVNVDAFGVPLTD